ncbi:MAG: hypothetical protein AAF250_08320 [Pseudomonadota bacterium]
MSEQLKSISSTRPIRVAYLIDPDNTPAELLDAIFADCYGRWGGRWSLIIPCEAGKPKVGYQALLECWDPDLIYSYVELDLGCHDLLHEKLYPSSVQVHQSSEGESRRDWRPSIRFRSVSSLSVLPWIAARQNSLRGGTPTLLDAYWSEPDPPRWICDSFGMPRISEGTTDVVEAASTVAPTNTLISRDRLENQTVAKSPTANYVVGQSAWLEKYANNSSALSLADAASFVSQRLDIRSKFGLTDLNLVVGDTVDDRLLFWNSYHSNPIRAPGVYSLRVDASIFEDEDEFETLVSLVSKRNQHWEGGRHRTIIRSCSIRNDALEEFAEKLRQSLKYHYVTYEALSSSEELIPDVSPHRYGNTVQHVWNHKTTGLNETGWFSGHKIQCRKPLPPQFQDISNVPLPLRGGLWMMDLRVDRRDNHSQYSNISHWWRLPRRLRLAFSFIQRGSVSAYSSAGFIDLLPRVTILGELSVPTSLVTDAPQLSVPKDDEVLRYALYSAKDWISHQGLSESATDTDLWQGFRDTETSDKGRYLIGTLQLLGGLAKSFEILTDRFWLELFDRLGGGDAGAIDRSLDDLLTKLKKKEQFKSFPLEIENETDLRSLLENASTVSRKGDQRRPSLPFSKVISQWESTQNEDGLDHLDETEKADWASWERERITNTIRYLSKKGVLRQGQRWRCGNCFSQNWLGIDELTPTWHCPVCGHSKAANVDGEWEFQLNDFLKAAIRDHGILATIWCLHALRDRSRSSFYFLPSTNLFLQSPTSARVAPNAEIDLLAVVDGQTYLCEVKSSQRVSDKELGAFAAVANKIRPNVAMLAILNCDTKRRSALKTKLEGLLDAGIAVEVISQDHH